MGMTMTQKILAHHAGVDSVTPGDLINARLDLVMGSDVTTPIALQEMKKHNLDNVFDSDRIVLVMDHFAPNKDITAARNCAMVRTFAKEYGIKNFFDGGRMGIEHALLPEQGFVAPGELIIGADSHTCTYGALGAFSTGVGSTDMAGGMVSGRSWFKVPEAIKIELTGETPAYVCGKDLILYIIGKIGVDGARYKSLEFFGDGIKSLSIDDRFSVCNMAIEAGAKNAIFPVDQTTLDYLKGRVYREYTVAEPDTDAQYVQTLRIDLSQLTSVVAAPHLPSNVNPVEEYAGLKVDQIIIGCCTNGHISDLRQAAAILKGKTVAHNVRCIIIPATWQVYLEAMEEGLVRLFIEAGATVSMPTCGPCNGGHVGVLSDGERCVSTTNRNFVGRMGAKSSEVYLASPAVAAACAVAGMIVSPKEVM
jgi:3-isopropylmalate/(R)-2-methylmalate dehydratase large subunit